MNPPAVMIREKARDPVPAPQSSLMKTLAKAHFRTLAPQLPLNWTTPSGNPAGQQYNNAFKPGELTAVKPPAPPGLFAAATTNQYHCNTASEISDKMEAYIDGICDAICTAWSQWQSSATLTGVVINAVAATGGMVNGPIWHPLILMNAPIGTLQEAKYSLAIAAAITTGWTAYQATIKVPGLPWYPAFAAVPAPMAPPMPNVPCPVGGLMQVTAPVSNTILKLYMISYFGEPTALHSEILFESIAVAFEKCFILWQGQTQVTNVLGTGPVPTFAPPIVPVGPVVMGAGNMPPGGFV